MASARTSGILAAVAAEALYGMSYVLTRGALDTVSPWALLAWRFDLALAVMAVLAVLGVIRIRLRRSMLGALALLALLDPVLYYVGETLGVQRTSASVSGLVLAMIPVASIVAAMVLLGTRPTRSQLVGVAITVAGVATTVLATGAPRGAQGLGFAMLFLAVLAFALYAVAAEREAEASDTDKTFAMILVAAVVFTGVALLDQGPAALVGAVSTPGVALRVVGLAVGCTVGAYFLQNLGITRIGSASYATFVGVSSVVALAAGALLLGERLLPLQLLGGLGVLVGVWVANRQPSGRQPQR